MFPLRQKKGDEKINNGEKALQSFENPNWTFSKSAKKVGLKKIQDIKHMGREEQEQKYCLFIHGRSFWEIWKDHLQV